VRLPRRKFTFLRGSLVFILIISWIFSGWPPIWQNPRIPPGIERALALNQLANWAFTGNSTGWSSTNGSGTDTCGNTTSATTNNMATFAYNANKWRSITGTTASTNYRGMVYQTFTAPGSGTVKIKGNLNLDADVAGGGSWGSGWIRLDIYDSANSTYVANLACESFTSNQTAYDTSFGTASLTGGTTYAVRITMSGTVGSKALTFLIDNITINTAPVGLAASSPSADTNVTLNWTTSAEGSGAPAIHGTTPYKVYRDTSSPVSTFLANATTNSYTDTSTNGGTTYYYAVSNVDANSIESPLSAEVSQLTRPAAPTSVAATDGSAIDKVTITWTKSTGATDYHVWRDSTDLGAAGDVATFDDTGADAPTITPGASAASDGTSADYVALSVSGQSANNGTTHTYKVVASNATGNSTDSATDTGYRGVGSLTYQWQRSAADSDASYSNIDGATTASYNDTGAPSDGSGRYYKVVLNATGASQQTSSADRGYRLSGSLTTDIVDGSYVTVGSPTMAMNSATFSLICQTVTGSFGTASQQIYVNNNDAADGGWTLSLAATNPTDVWDSAGTDYDFNEAGSSGCVDDGATTDSDSLGGQMTVDPSGATLAVGQCGGCSTTGVSLGDSEAFVETSNNDIDILNGAAGSDDIGDWTVIGVSISQKIPAEQAAASDYDINMVLTITAI